MGPWQPGHLQWDLLLLRSASPDTGLLRYGAACGRHSSPGAAIAPSHPPCCCASVWHSALVADSSASLGDRCS